MTCSISPKFYRPIAVLLASVLVQAFLITGIGSAGEQVEKLAVIKSQLVTRLHLKADSHPRWARFSPVNPRLILLDIDGQGVIASLPMGTIRHIPQGMLPVGWLGQSVVVRDHSGSFRLLDGEGLTPSKHLIMGALSLPWTLGKNRRLSLNLKLPETGSTMALSRIPGAEIKDLPLITLEDQASLHVNPDGAGRDVLDASGQVVFRGSKKIYGIALSPDAYRLIVYYGNTEYVLFNRLTGRRINLPATMHAWVWLPDSTTLLGEVSITADNRVEEVARTELYVFETVGQRLARINLPSPVQGASLRILDVSTSGEILVEAERVVPEYAYLGLMVYELVWP